MRCELRNRVRFSRKRFEKCQIISFFIDDIFKKEFVKQRIAFLQEAFLVFTREDKTGSIRQDCQRSRLCPRELVRSNTKVTPRCHIKSHHIATKGCVRGVELEDALLRIAELQSGSPYHFNKFLKISALLVLASDAYHLLGERTPPPCNLSVGNIAIERLGY